MKKEQASHKKKKPDAMELSLLCYQMALIFKSGVNPVEGIPLLAEEITNTDMKASLAFISEKIVNGMSVYDSFSLEGSFPDYMLHMIRIGELTGTMDTVMDNLSLYYENESDIKKQMRSAVTYPIILALLMLGVIALMILKVIPMFGQIVESLGGQLPGEAERLFSFTINMEKILLWLIAVLIPILVALFIFAKTIKGRFLLDQIKVNNPIIGSVYRKIIASRIGQGLSLTTQSGMNAIDGFNAVKGLIDNVYVTKRLQEASESITNGKSFSEAIKEADIFPELFNRMIKTGERSGSLDYIMKKVATVYGKEAELSIKKLSRAIEPTLVAVLSIILGIVLLAVMLPLIGIMSSLG